MKKFLTVLLVTLLIYIPNKIEASEARVIDDANVLSSQEVLEIENSLKEVSDKYNINVAFYTTYEYPENNISYQAAEKFESCGYYDGFIFIVNLEIMEYDIVTMGTSEYLRGYLQEGLDVVYDSLVNKDYVLANKQFASFIDYAYQDYEYSNRPVEPIEKKPMSLTMKLAISALAGGVVSIIVLLILNGQLKTEGKKNNANNYVKPHSFELNRSGDIFLYRNVHRTRKPKNNNRGTGSSGHGSFASGTTSSGHSFSGGGGRKL